MIQMQLLCIWRYSFANCVSACGDWVNLLMLVEVKQFCILLVFVLAHCQIGRKIFRQRLEVGDRDADIEQRRVTQLYNYFNQ